jgi:hypothetical protein
MELPNHHKSNSFLNSNKKYDSIVIIYPPKFGGHHLANLISLSKFVQNRFESDNYYVDLLSRQKNHSEKNAHIVDINKKFQFNDYNKDLKKIKILSAHLSEFYWAYEDANKNLGKKVFISITFPDNLEIIPNNRRSRYFENEYYYQELRTIYTPYVISKMFELEHSTIITIPADILFSNDITEIVNRLNFLLELDLPMEICQKLHNIWISKINDA